MKQKTLLTMLTWMLLFIHGAEAQTYFHDASVMNQFTVAETGVGSLMPDAYYATLHNRYRQEAYTTGKQEFRTQLLLLLHQEVPYAEAIDSIHRYRAEIEALNMAERTPGVSDVAWQMEKDKITKKQDVFKKNIDQITRVGGSSTDRSDWLAIYRSIDCGLQAVRDAYLPMSMRKREYLAIYKDLVKYNSALCQYLNQLKHCKDLNCEAVKPDTVSVENVARNAYSRWKNTITVSLGRSSM